MPLNRVYTPHMHRGVGRTRQRALFIGRSAERDRLATLGAGPSEPHVVLVRGEAGVGKTSLLRVASWDLEEQGKSMGPEFWKAVQALGEKAYYPEIRIPR